MLVLGQLEQAQLEQATPGTLDGPDTTGRVYADVTDPSAALAMFYNGSAWVQLAPIGIDIFTLTETTTPAPPAVGKDKIYFKSDHKLYAINSDGAEVLIGPSSTTSLAVNNITSNYVSTIADDVIRVDATLGPIQITLPAASTTGKLLRFKRIDSSLYAVTIIRAGSDLIDGETSQVLPTQYYTLELISSGGTAWDVY